MQNYIASAVAILVIASLAAFVGVGLQNPSPEPEMRRPFLVKGEGVEHAAATVHLSEFGAGHGRSVILFTSNSFTRKAFWEDDVNLVTIEDVESGFGVESFDSKTLSTSFGVRGVSSIGASDLYVIGRARNGDDIVERWTVPDQVGGYRTVGANSQSTVFGVSSPPVGPTLGVGGGGPYLPPGQRSAREPIVREELFRGDLGGLLSATPELLGRYLAVLNEAGEVLQLLSGAQGYFVQGVIADMGGTPQLGDCGVLYAFGSGSDFCIVARPQSGPEKHFMATYMWDYGNDGGFDLAADTHTGANPFSGVPYEVFLYR